MKCGAIAIRHDARRSLRGITLSDRWFNGLVIGAVALGFVLLVAVGVVAAWTILENQAQTRWVNHTYGVQRAIGRYRGLTERAEAVRRGLLLRSDAGFYDTFYRTTAEIEPALAELQRQTADNPRQRQNVAYASALSRRHLQLLNRSVRLLRDNKRDAAITSFNVDEPWPLIRDIRQVGARMTAEEDRLLAIRNAEQRATLTRFYLTLGLAGVLLVLVGAGSLWIIIHYTRDLARSRDQLRRLNTDLEGAVLERTTDLQRANDEIQRFAYIVSHDLRSPLVNVMGFTAELEAGAQRLSAMVERVEGKAPELVDQDAKAAVREDFPEAIRFIRASTEKMDRLINAILRLSREGRRTINPEKLDMGALFRSVTDSLRHTIDERDVDLSIDPRLPAIVSDRLAVEQIVSNIVENAIKYMVPGRRGRIEIRGHIEGPRAIFEIADNGRGVEPRDHERIFDLFRRSGQQDQPGEGIGLAHTRALAYRLGGTISVESELARGATFRINLPVTFTGEQKASI